MVYYCFTDITWNIRSYKKKVIIAHLCLYIYILYIVLRIFHLQSYNFIHDESVELLWFLRCRDSWPKWGPPSHQGPVLFLGMDNIPCLNSRHRSARGSPGGPNMKIGGRNPHVAWGFPPNYGRITKKGLNKTCLQPKPYTLQPDITKMYMHMHQKPSGPPKKY